MESDNFLTIRFLFHLYIMWWGLNLVMQNLDRRVPMDGKISIRYFKSMSMKQLNEPMKHRVAIHFIAITTSRFGPISWTSRRARSLVTDGWVRFLHQRVPSFTWCSQVWASWTRWYFQGNLEEEKEDGGKESLSNSPIFLCDFPFNSWSNPPGWTYRPQCILHFSW